MKMIITNTHQNSNNSLDDRYDETSLHNGENDNYDTASRSNDNGAHANRSSNDKQNEQGACKLLVVKVANDVLEWRSYRKGFKRG